jgi:hypothetical protein
MLRYNSVCRLLTATWMAWTRCNMLTSRQTELRALGYNAPKSIRKTNINIPTILAFFRIILIINSSAQSLEHHLLISLSIFQYLQLKYPFQPHSYTPCLSTLRTSPAWKAKCSSSLAAMLACKHYPTTFHRIFNSLTLSKGLLHSPPPRSPRRTRLHVHPLY